MSRIFVLIKQWGIPSTEKILDAFDAHGERIRMVKIRSLPLKCAARLYSDSRKKKDRDWRAIVIDMADSPVFLVEYEGDYGEFNRVKEMLRAELPVAPIDGHLRNVVHVSESRKDYEREKRAFQDFLE